LGCFLITNEITDISIDFATTKDNGKKMRSSANFNNGDDPIDPPIPPPSENKAPTIPTLIAPANNSLCLDNSQNFKLPTSRMKEAQLNPTPNPVKHIRYDSYNNFSPKLKVSFQKSSLSIIDKTNNLLTYKCYYTQVLEKLK